MLGITVNNVTLLNIF